MKIPRYWARGEASSMDQSGKDVSFSCWRWSDMNADDARTSAEKRAGELLARFISGERLNHYSYGDRPIREETVETVKGPGKKELGIITRNVYGALVLNAANALFMDVDFTGKGKGFVSSVLALFGKKGVGEEESRMARINEWAGRRPDLDLIVYRTFAGLRVIVTNKTFDPAGDEAMELMNEIGSDPLYMRLCKKQQSFRARLTPKPWRMPMPKPPWRWPFENPDQERETREWEKQYESASGNFAVCRELTRIGSSSIHSEIQPIIDVHDRYCLGGAGMGLA